MAQNWYPIINSNCKMCMACVISCPHQLLVDNGGQINLLNSEKCPENCKVCKLACKFGAISYFDGTTESLMNSFKGECGCGCGGHH